MNPTTLIIFAVLMVGMMYFQMRTQKKQSQKRQDEISKLVKGDEIVTIGGLYGTVDEVLADENKIVLDIDGVYLTFELSAIKRVLPRTEGALATSTEAAGSEESIIEE
ncbi:MAG: preprotein translocase subunit YajC [Streptococcus sp.]|nr:preprotein translocase subunit YajC [Streptococcus sp.]